MASEKAEHALSRGDGIFIRNARISLASASIEKEFYAAMAGLVSSDKRLETDLTRIIHEVLAVQIGRTDLAA